MDWGALLSTFGLVFIAELGDKTQLAVVTQTCKHRRPLAVFLGASLALAMVTAIGAVGGHLMGRLLAPSVLRYVAAAAFVTVGLLIVARLIRSRGDAPGQGTACGCVDGQGESGSSAASLWDWKAFSSTLALLSVAEMGDKTQLTVLSMAGRASGAWPVFLGGAAALTGVTALGVIGGQALCALIPERLLIWISASAFVAMGALIGFGVL